MRGAFLDRHIEKLLLAAAVLALVGYLATGFSAGTGANTDQLLAGGVQYYAEQGGADERYAPGKYLKPTVAAGGYDEVARFVFVVPKLTTKRVFRRLDLAVPHPQVAPPPAPLPDPGPSLTHSRALPRMTFEGPIVPAGGKSQTQERNPAQRE